VLHRSATPSVPSHRTASIAASTSNVR
jgi:hypothetical protein